MSLWIKIVIGILVFVALLVGLVFYATSGVTRVADQFMQAVGAGNLATARAAMTADFSARVDEETLRKLFAAHGISSVRETSWASRSVNNGTGKVEGTVTTDTGAMVPIQLDLLKEDGSWKVGAIRTPQAGLSSGQSSHSASAPDMPDTAQQQALLQQSLSTFAFSTKNRDMTLFYSALTPMWQRQTSVADLNATFASFMPMSEALMALITVPPVPTAAPTIDENGILDLTGYYPSGAMRLTFKQGFLQEDGVWRLIRFNLKIIDAPTDEEPATP